MVNRTSDDIRDPERLEALDSQLYDRLKGILESKGPVALKVSALDRLKGIKEPRNDLVQQVCSIMCDENVPPELRIRAVHLIRDFVVALKGKNAVIPNYRGVSIVDRMKELVGKPMHQILQVRIVRALEEIG